MAVFSLHMVGFGYRSLFLKPLAGSARVVALDWSAAGVGLAVFPGTVACAFWAGNIPIDLFGSLGATTTFRQLRGYANAGHWAKNQWLLNHILGFRASYIAALSALSALSVTSLQFLSVQFPMADGARHAPHQLVAPLGARTARYAGTKLRFIRLTSAGPS